MFVRFMFPKQKKGKRDILEEIQYGEYRRQFVTNESWCPEYLRAEREYQDYLLHRDMARIA